MRGAALTLALALPAFALSACNPGPDLGARCRASAPRVSDTAVRATLDQAGLVNLRSLGTEEGCIEAKGTDRNGARFEVYLNPGTGQIVHRK